MRILLQMVVRHMRDTDFAYSVARIRANENSLLSPASVEQLIAAPDIAGALRVLADNGWQVPANSDGIAAMHEGESVKTWQLLTQSVPDIGVFDALIIANDFHNLKAALKAVFSSLKPSDYFIEPCLVPPPLIGEAVEKMRFELLPAYMRQPAQDAYDAIVRLENGRLADIFLDTAALDTAIDFAKDSGSELLMEITQLAGAAANIKTAVRCAAIGRDVDFTLRALCRGELIDNRELVSAALAGEEALLSFVASSPLAEAAEPLKSGLTAFEKWCDEAIAGLVKNAKFTPLGPDPVIAYYIHRDAEIKNVRIILNAKMNVLPAQIIGKRVREVYV